MSETIWKSDIREGSADNLIRAVFFYPTYIGGDPVVYLAPSEEEMVRALSHMWENVREGEAGEEWTVYVDWITQEQYDALGEHEGW